MSQFDDDLEANLGALFKPTQSDSEKFETAIDLAMKIGEEIPILGLAVKIVAWREAWFGDGKKTDRATPVLLGLYERTRRLEAAAKDSLRKDQPEAMQAIVEEALKRIADQPDDSRRDDMRRILYRILEKPRDLAENKMFVRLADELPVQALKLLTATHGSLAMGFSTRNGLAKQSEVQDFDVTHWLTFLIGQGLVDEEMLGKTQYTTYEGVLTPLGKAFEEYRRA